jgi:UDP-N-acetylmuramoyl-tripeptide--D-alanyl-D-alanine ligase
VIGLTIGDIAGLTDGTPSDLGGPAELSAIVDGPVVADSRNVVPGSLFVAIAGARADGHDFAAQAIAAGAKVVLAARPVGAPAVVVDDTVLGLGRLARGYLARLPDPVVVGITGSSGKTSTKDIVGQLLAEVGSTVAPIGSLNTEVGLPLTVLRAGVDTQYLVLEFSARGLDHIAYLCGVARPRIGVVLNVGAAHLGEFGSRDVVGRAKGELIEALPDDGVAVLNADDDVVVAMKSRTRSRVVTFGVGHDADVRAADVRLDGLARPSFRLFANGSVADVALSLHGEHQVSNALAAAAVALELGLALDVVAAALGRVRPISAWRMQVTTRSDGVTVINDAYNANPESMRAALAALAAMGRPDRRTHAVLGPMAELGPAADEEHRELGKTVAALGVRRLVVVGPAATAIADGAIAAGFDVSSVTVVDDVAAAVKALDADLRPDDVVLVKASRSADLQRVAEALLLGMPRLGAPDGAGR